LLQSNSSRVFWNTGYIQFAMHDLLGRIALAAGDVATAKRELMLAVKDNPGMGHHNDYTRDGLEERHLLAAELVRKGETTAVLEYLDALTKFWKRPYPLDPEGKISSYVENDIDGWRQQVRAGKVPDDYNWR
jgi:hypothetical protein